MGFYNKYILPKDVHFACGTKPAMRQREPTGLVLTTLARLSQFGECRVGGVLAAVLGVACAIGRATKSAKFALYQALSPTIL